MKCKKFKDLVFSYQDRLLSQPERAEFERHGRECPSCAGEFSALEKIGSLLAEQAAVVPVPDWDRSWQKIAAATQPRPRRKMILPLFPRWVPVASGLLVFFILGVISARLFFFPSRTEMAAPAEAPFLYSAQDYFAALQPVLSEFSNASGQKGGDTTGRERVRRLLDNLQLLRLRAEKNKDSNLRRLLNDIELVLLEIAHLDRSDPENTRLIGALIYEKGIPMKIKVFKFAERKITRI